jgi:hypothetical protein
MVGREIRLRYDEASRIFVQEFRYAICRYCKQVMQPRCGAGLFWYFCPHCHATSPKCASRNEASQRVEEGR